MNRAVKARSAAGLVIAGVLALTGCAAAEEAPESESTAGSGQSPSWAAVEKAAIAEGQLTWYSSAQNTANIPLVAAFNKKYPGIQVSITRLISGELTTRFSSEKEAGAPSADVVQNSDDVMMAAHPEWFAKIDTTVVPNLAIIPEKDLAKLVKPRYFAVSASPFTITINTNLIKKDPKTWQDLINSPWIGKGTLADPRSSPSIMAGYAVLRETYGDSYLKKLGAAGNSFYKAVATQAPQVAAGAAGYLAPTAGENTKALRDANAPLKITVPTPIIALTASVGINSKAAHPNAARVFANFVLSRQGQQTTCSSDVQTFLYSDIPGCVLADEKLRVVDYARGAKESKEISALLGLE